MLTVTDGGRGMSAEECERVFEAYWCSPSNRGGGTGLGLYICQCFSEAMHGSIGVESEPGKGARFTIRVPAVEVLEAPAQDAPCSPRQLLPSSPPLSPQLSPPRSPGGSARGAAAAPRRDIVPKRNGRRLRALLVDDHNLNRKLCSKLLELQGGVDVSTADDGDVAVRLMTESYGPGCQPFDFVLMDLAMPRCGSAHAVTCAGHAHERCAMHAGWTAFRRRGSIAHGRRSTCRQRTTSSSSHLARMCSRRRTRNAPTLASTVRCKRVAGLILSAARRNACLLTAPMLAGFLAKPLRLDALLAALRGAKLA